MNQYLRIKLLITFSFLLLCSCIDDCSHPDQIEFLSTGSFKMNEETKILKVYISRKKDVLRVSVKYNIEPYQHWFSFQNINIVDSVQNLNFDRNIDQEASAFSEIDNFCDDLSTQYKLDLNDELEDFFILTEFDTISDFYKGEFQMSFDTIFFPNSNDPISALHPLSFEITEGKFEGFVQ